MSGNVLSGESWGQLGVQIPHGAYGEIRQPCPQCSPQRHKEWEKCLAINLDKGTGRCHHCDARFSVKANLSDGYGSVPRLVHRRAAARLPKYRPAEEFDAASATVHNWLLKQRAIPAAISKEMQIEGRETWMYSATKGEEGGITRAMTFPYLRAGKVINVKYRTEDKRFKMVKEAELCLYNLDNIDPDLLIWTEGEIDVLSVMAAGFKSCVSVPNGAPALTVKDFDGHFAYLESDIERILGVTTHILAVDNDEPGLRLRDELARRLDPTRCKLVTWPRGCKDANDVLREHGAEKLRDCILNARDVPVEGVFDVASLGEQIAALAEDTRPGGFHPGNDELAEYYTVPPGQWTIVTGLPGSGKSAWLDWLMVNMMERHNWRFAICSPENQPIARHAAQLLQIKTGKPFRDGPTPPMTPDERDEALAWLDQHATFILPPEDTPNAYGIDNILHLCRIAVIRHGVRGVIIDPWNELEHSRPAGMREDEYISQSITKIRRFARAHGVHVWLVAHPTKLQRNKESGEYDPPGLYDIAGGAHWRNKADMGITVHRELTDPSKPTQVIVRKVRFRECGKLGEVNLWFDPVNGRYASGGPTERRYQHVADDREPVAPKRRAARQRTLVDDDE